MRDMPSSSENSVCVCRCVNISDEGILPRGKPLGDPPKAIFPKVER